MDIRKLEAFCKVYEYRNFSKAGEVLFLSQPTISSHVANLEAELGVNLFDRLGRKIVPTEAGKVLYGQAVRVFKDLDEARAAIEMLRDNVVGELAIGCSTIPSHYIVPQMLGRFSAQYPHVHYKVFGGDSSDVIQKVAQGEWPIGIVGKAPQEEGIVSHELLVDDTILVAPSSAPWMPKDTSSVSVDELIRLPWVMRENGSGTRLVLEEMLGTVGLSSKDLHIRSQVTTTSESLAHTAAGVGVSVTSVLAAQSVLASGVVTQLSVPEVASQRTFYLVYHGERHLFPALESFIHFALDRS